MKLSKLIMGSMETNCYVILDEPSGLGAVIDPGIFSAELWAEIGTMRIRKLQYILLTHGHFDHILGVHELKRRYPDAKVVISDEDEICLSSPACSLASDKDLEQHPMHADITVKDGSVLTFGSSEIKVIATPGHTPGSVCYSVGNIMFSGDTLFCRTCGRTDLFRGNLTDMQASIMKLGKLTGDYIVYPGHGVFTSLDAERKSNRFMRKIQWSLI